MGRDPAAWAATLDAAFLHCRDLSHSWDHYTASYDNQARRYHRTLRCSSCGTERVQELDAYGEVVKNLYHYGDGYLLPKDVTRPDPGVGKTIPRSTFRLAALTRMTGTP